MKLPVNREVVRFLSSTAPNRAERKSVYTWKHEEFVISCSLKAAAEFNVTNTKGNRKKTFFLPESSLFLRLRLFSPLLSLSSTGGAIIDPINPNKASEEQQQVQSFVFLTLLWNYLLFWWVRKKINRLQIHRAELGQFEETKPFVTEEIIPVPADFHTFSTKHQQWDEAAVTLKF